MAAKDARPRAATPARGAFAPVKKVPAPVVPAAPKAAPTAAPMTKAGARTYTESLEKLRSSTVKTWAAFNNKMSDQERVIAVKTPEGRFIHPACADKNGVALPNVVPLPVTVPANMSTKIAQAGGAVCAACNTFIVAPVNKRGLEKASADWEKANQAFIDGQASAEAFLAAANRYASSRAGVTGLS